MKLKYKYEKKAFVNLISKGCLNGRINILLDKLISKSKKAITLKKKVSENNRIKNWKRYYFNVFKYFNLHLNDEKIILGVNIKVWYNKNDNKFEYETVILELWAFDLYWYVNAGFFGIYHGNFTCEKKHWMSPSIDIPPKRSWSTGIKINILPIIETAWKERWLLIAMHRRFNIYAETLPDKFGLPTFSRKELHKVKTFVNHNDYSMYLDYISLGNQLYRNWSHDNYFREDWKHQHQRHINIINRQKERNKELQNKKINMLQKLKDDPVLLYKPKSNNDLKIIGKTFNNCIGSVYKNFNEFRVYKVKKESLAVRVVDNKVVEARFNYNVNANETIYKKLQLQINKEAMETLKANQMKGAKNG